jgi:hypothetical protein
MSGHRHSRCWRPPTTGSPAGRRACQAAVPRAATHGARRHRRHSPTHLGLREATAWVASGGDRALRVASRQTRKESAVDDSRFDAWTRRHIGLAAGGFAALLLGRAGLDPAGTQAKKRKSKRKRCRQKKRTFCAGRCCPKHHRCEGGSCLRSCPTPCPPGQPGGSCVGDEACFCAFTSTGTTVLLQSPTNTYCLANPSCGPTKFCPPGRVCATCGCGPSACDFRCFDPCPPG